MNFLTRFLQSLFLGIEPERIARWVRGLFFGIAGALSQGVIDLLSQVLGLLTNNEPVLVNISWQLIARTIAIAVIPAIILYLKSPISAPDGVIYADGEKVRRSGYIAPRDLD